jgi:ribosomal protein L17
LAARRAIKAELFDPMAVTKLMDDAANRAGTRTSGFVRITKLPARPGDGAKMVELEILFTPLEAAPAGDADVKVRRAKKTEV